MIHLVVVSSEVDGAVRRVASLARGGEMVPAGILPFFRLAQIRRRPCTPPATGNFFMRGDVRAVINLFDGDMMCLSLVV